jgi:chromosome segregation ATPase
VQLREQVVEFDVRYKKLELEYHNSARSLHAAEEMIKADPNTFVAKESWIAFKALNDEMKQLQVNHESLKREFMNLQLSFIDLKAELSRKNSMIDVFSDPSLNVDSTKVNEDSTDYQALVEAKAQETDQLLQKYNQISKQFTLKKEENESLLTTLHCSEERLRILESAIDEASEQLALFNAGTIEQEIKHANLKSSISTIQQDLSEYRESAEELEKQKTSIGNDLTDLRAERDRLKEALEDICEELELKTETLKTKSERFGELETQIKDRTSVVLALNAIKAAKFTQATGGKPEESKPARKR